MKTNFLAKHKWWVLAIVLMIALMAASVSYSAWDTLSFKAIMNAKGGDFTEKPPAPVWSDHIKGPNGETLTSIPALGSTVTYGNFYKASNAVTTGATEPQCWIVVNIDKDNVATLLSEKVVVYGNYWGNASGSSHAQKFLNDYYRSTVRSWLNSGKGSLMGSGTTWKDTERYNDNTRNDGLPGFSGTASQVNKGFLDVAFNDAEKKLLVPKSISGMKYLNTSNKPINSTTTTGRTSINDLVWLPSYQEIYGAGNTPSGRPPIDQGYSQFQSISNTIKITGGTPYAQNAVLSSYYNNGGGSANGSETAAWWWLRSPHPSDLGASLFVPSNGSSISTYYSGGGVRPAVCVQL